MSAASFLGIAGLVAVSGFDGLIYSIGFLVAFLTVMAERRRIRRRDGARNWHLLRDLADRTRWIERYHVPTWVDYVRHNQRRTRADAAISEELRRLHQGTWPPPIARMLERDIGATLGDRLGNILPGMRQVHW